IRKGWHTYWRNPGDAGFPTTAKWQLPEGWKAGDIQWPYPKRLPLEQLMTYGYQDEVSLPVDISVPADAKPGEGAIVSADLMYLVCTDASGVCVPEESHVSVPLGIAAQTPPPDGKTAAFFADARSKLAHASPWKAVYDAGDKRFALLIESPELVSARPRDVAFYPYTDGYVQAGAPQRLGTSDKGFVIEGVTDRKLATQEKRASAGKIGGVLVLTGADGRVDALDVDAEPGPVPASSVTLLQNTSNEVGFAAALLFAVLGGLILNLMPCVFPVLSMKALALAAKREAPHRAKAAALAYGAGVLVSFLALGGALVVLRGGSAGLGWGFQLQQPLFVSALALLMFAVGLNLSGLYEIGGGRLSGMGGRLAGKEGAAGSFFTGVLAVVVATPCTAPFMGAAMGYALTQNAGVALAIFAGLGVGFAAPFMVLGLWPRALGVLPRPGAWMTTLRQVLAFPMYGAAIWLVWVLSLQAGSDGVLAVLAGALALAFGLWIYGRSQAAHGTGRTLGFAAAAVAILAAIVLIPLTGVGARPAGTAGVGLEGGGLAYEPFSASRLQSLRQEGRPVFINATAAWCITCLVNERVALSGSRLGEAFAARKVAALKADWTTQDSAITALLASQGRSGVPLYLYYAPGAEKPAVLPQLLTESTVMAALDNAQ
ncbi:MAG TPA: protein-disulfide reductase DsbD domain-containing protein, partial [Micropepsaceae bacterium]